MEGVWFQDLGCVFKQHFSTFESGIMARVMLAAQVLVPGGGRSSDAQGVGCSEKGVGEGPTSQLCFSSRDLIKPLLCQYS